MGKKSIDRTGEKGINNFGSEMIITRCMGAKDIYVYFPEYDWTWKNAQYQNFKDGKIKCPYEPAIFGVGYIGEGDYKVCENGKVTKVYNTWHNMLRRCYSEKEHKRHPTYKDCEAYKDWLNFQNYGEWFDNNYYEVDDEKMELDKDILFKHNKIYSPKTCVFVPQAINKLFVKRDNDRGDSPIGTTPVNGKYVVHCNLINPETGKSKRKYFGYYETQEKAFEVYKYYKEKNIKEVADYYKDKIPERLYNAMYNYIVEIDD